MNIVLTLALALVVLQAPVRSVPPTLPAAPPAEEFLTNRPANVPTSSEGVDYLIGRDDLIEVTVFEKPDLSSTTRVSASGTVTLSLGGEFKAAGKRPTELAKEIEVRLEEKYLNNPRVSVFVREYASQPVSVYGAVRAPGIYQLKGQKTLLEVLSMAQGRDTTAGNMVQVLRRGGQQGVADGSVSSPSTIVIDMEELDRGRTELNVPIQSGDIINVLQAGSIFVIGEVNHQGEFILRNGKNITALQALAYGAGPTKDAKRAKAMVVRIHEGGKREEFPVDLDKIGKGLAPDMTMQADDILFIPSNKAKTALMRTLDTTIGVVSGRLIYGF